MLHTIANNILNGFFLSVGPTEKVGVALVIGDVAKRKGTYSPKSEPKNPDTSPATLRLWKADSNMFAGGSRASHHLRECDRRHLGLGLGLGLGFYSSRVVRFSSLVFTPPSTAPRLHSRMSSSSSCLPHSGPPRGETVPTLSGCLRSQSLSNCVRLRFFPRFSSRAGSNIRVIFIFSFAMKPTRRHLRDLFSRNILCCRFLSYFLVVIKCNASWYVYVVVATATQSGTCFYCSCSVSSCFLSRLSETSSWLGSDCPLNDHQYDSFFFLIFFVFIPLNVNSPRHWTDLLVILLLAGTISSS